MATEPNPDTPSAAELAEALRALLAPPTARLTNACDIASATLARYDAAQKSPLDALLAWAPWPGVQDGDDIISANGDFLVYSSAATDDAGHGPALLRLLAAAPQMLDALRKIAVYPEYRHSEPGDAFGAISNIAKIALQAAGDKP
jgi:hypothetical protein